MIFWSSGVQKFRSSDITLFAYAGILGGSGRISYQSFYAPSPFGATPSSHEGDEVTLYFRSSEVQKFRSSDITLFAYAGILGGSGRNPIRVSTPPAPSGPPPLRMRGTKLPCTSGVLEFRHYSFLPWSADVTLFALEF